MSERQPSPHGNGIAAPTKRVLLLTDVFGGVHGGTEGQVLTLVERVAPGWAFELWVLQQSDYLQQNDFPCPWRVIGLPGYRAPLFLPKFKRLARAIERAEFDLIHGFHADTCLIAPWLGRETGLPVITSRRDFGYWQTPRILDMLRNTNRAATGFIANCRAVGARTANVEYAHPDKVHVVLNGHDPKRFETQADPSLRARLGLPNDALVIGLVANVRPLKRQTDLIDALALMGESARGAHVLLIGTGTEDELKALREHAASQGVGERVHIHGVTDDIVPWLRMLDIGVLASDSEGLSNAITEYLACSLPVVASRVGGNPELVRDGHNGFLFDARDVPALARALTTLIADDALRERFGRAGREHFDAHLHADRMVSETFKTYERVISSASKTARPAVAPALRVDTVTSIDALDDAADVVSAWERMLDDRAFFLSPTWVATWCAWRNRPPHILVARDRDGVVKGLLPLVEHSSGVVGFAGHAMGADHLDVVLEPSLDDDQAMQVSEALLSHLLASRVRRAELRHVRAEGKLRGALHESLASVPMRERYATICHAIDIDGTYAAYLQRRWSKKRRHELRRTCRRFFELDGARVVRATRPEHVAPMIARLFELHDARFKALGKHSGFEGGRRDAFHTALATKLLARDELYLSALEAEGRAVAVYYGFRFGGRLSHFQSGIDPTFDGPSPGTVLRAAMLEEDVFDAGLHTFDFLDGDEAYKRPWATSAVHLFDITLWPCSFEGRLRQRVASIADLAKNEIKRQLAKR